MSRQAPIGYYVHHHGAGHAARASAVAARLERATTFFSSLPASSLRTGALVPLPLDAGGCEDILPPDLHHAPLGSPGLARRMAMIAAWIAEHQPCLVVVDVSVEVAALVRLCGVPVVYVRQTGRRDDPPHRLAYRWAIGLLAPYSDWLEPPGTPPDLLRRTFHSGAITRFDGEPRPRRGAEARPSRALVVGASVSAAAIARAAPGWQVITSCGRQRDGHLANLVQIQPHELDLELFASCAVVVAAGGANTVAEAAFARCGLVCVPQPRPFGEQSARGRDLARLGAAVVLADEPEPSHWPRLLERAVERSRRLESWADGGGAGRAAAYLERLAAAAPPPAASNVPSCSSQWTSPSSSSSRSQPGAGQLPQRR